MELFGSVDGSGNPALLSRAAKASGLIYTAGLTARDPDGTVPKGIKVQTEMVFERLESVLKEAGASLRDVMKVNIFVVDLRDLPIMNDVYREFFPEAAPARAMVQVAGLADRDYLIEIEAIAQDPEWDKGDRGA